MGAISRVLSAPKNAIKWTTALTLTSEDKFQEALDTLNSINDERFNKEEVLLLKAFLYFSLHMDEKAKAAAQDFHQLIDALPSYSENERAYLKSYASDIGLKCSRGNPSLDLFQVRFDEIDLQSIPLHMKKNFPLRGHPDWVEP